MTTKIILAAVALVIAAAGTADAASKHKRKWVRHHAPAATYMPTSPYAIPGPRPVWAAPQQCFTDEGYGRYWPCGAGPDTR